MKVELLFERKTEPSHIEMPERWKIMDINGMVASGWRPRIKRVGDREYLTLRFGNQERSLGPATKERMNLLRQMYPHLNAMKLPISVVRVSIIGSAKQVDDIVRAIREAINNAKKWAPRSGRKPSILSVPVRRVPDEGEMYERKRIWEGYEEK